MHFSASAANLAAIKTLNDIEYRRQSDREVYDLGPQFARLSLKNQSEGRFRVRSVGFSPQSRLLILSFTLKADGSWAKAHTTGPHQFASENSGFQAGSPSGDSVFDQ